MCHKKSETNKGASLCLRKSERNVGRDEIKFKYANQTPRICLEVDRVQIKMKYPNQKSRIGLEVGRVQFKIKYPNQESFWESSYSIQKQTKLGEPYFDRYHTVVKSCQNWVNITLIGIIQFSKAVKIG